MSAISPIYHRGEREPAPIDEARFAEACRDLWHDRGHVVLKADELRLMSPVVRMTLDAWAIGRWGKRKDEAHG